jgi:hypothetical protein
MTEAPTGAPAPETTAAPTPPPVATEPTQAPAATEGDAQATLEPKKNTELFTNRFARLTQAQQEIARKEQELARQREEIESKRELLDLISDPNKIYEDPTAALEKLGLSYDQITRSILNSNSPEKVQSKVLATLQSKLESLEADIEKHKQEKVELQAQQEDQANQATIEEYRNLITKTVDENPDTYELINKSNNHKLVWRWIETHFEKTGKVLGVKEACDAIEAMLEKDLIEPLAGTAKLKKKLGLSANASDKTLNASQTSPSAAVETSPALSEEERFERALAVLKKGK